jgi:hypothetical protein
VVTAVLQTDPFGAPDSDVSLPSVRMGLHGWSLHLPDFCGTNINHMNSIEKMAKAIKKLCNTDFSTDSRICGRCHVTTETASHILRERVASADLRFRRLGKHFMEQSYYDDIPLRKILYFVE